MKKRRSKRRIKWGRVLFSIIFLMIIIGGVTMYYNYNFKNSNSLNKNEDLETGDKNQVNDKNRIYNH